MSSRAISGKPGGGKSYFAVEQLVAIELMNTARFIVSNMPLKPMRVIEFCAKAGREDIAFDERVLLVGNDNVRLNKAVHGDEALRSFWRFRSPELILPDIDDKQIKSGERPAMETFGSVGVHYFLDEWHEFCNSRQWATTGPMLLWYIAKHRHFGDDVTWITQHVPNVDKQWRSVTQDYRYCRNFGKEKFRGFNKGSFITVTTYLEPFTGTQTPQNVEKFKIDPKGIGSCYYTSLAGTDADTKEKKTGPSIKWVYVAILVIAAILFWFFTSGIQMGAKKVMGLDRRLEPRNSGSAGPSGPIFPNVSNPPSSLPIPEPKPWHVLSLPLKDTTSSQVIDSMKADAFSIPGVLVSANSSNNALILAGDDFQKLSVLAEILKQYDVESRLVTVNCVVGRLVRGKGSKVGLYDILQQSARQSDGVLTDVLASAVYDFSTGIATFGTTIAAREMLVALTDFKVSDTRFEVVSRPTLSVVAGKSAEFSTGQEIPYATSTLNNVASESSVNFKKAEFTFTVKPTVRKDGWVRLEIEQSNSDVLSTSDIDGNDVPRLSTQHVKTLIDLNPLQVAYLGGINIRTLKGDRRGVPILRDIPGINLIFSTKEKSEEVSELVILVSVDVHAASESPARVLRALPVHKPTLNDAWLDDVSTLSGVVAPETRQGGQLKDQTKGK